MRNTIAPNGIEMVSVHGPYGGATPDALNSWKNTGLTTHSPVVQFKANPPIPTRINAIHGHFLPRSVVRAQTIMAYRVRSGKMTTKARTA